MRDYSTGELLFRLVCLVVLSSVESFNWTAQPTNPTPAIKGQVVSLAWNYSLTADELLQSQTQFAIFWKKLNQLTLDYDKIGAKSYFQFIGGFNYQEPQSPRIVIDRSDQATLHIKDVRKEDEGTYKIEFTLKTDGSVLSEQRVNLTVLEHPALDYTSKDQDVCEDSMVTLYCNATGKPAPNINWTRVWENGTDSEQLPVVDGSYVMSNIKRSSKGTYRCTAYNGVGDPVNRTVKVIVRYSASVVRVVKSSNIVIEGDNFSLSCEESGDPEPIVTWITVSNNEHSYGNILNFTNITRGDSGDYRCETKNKCGKESRNESINVFYRPTATREGDIIHVSKGDPASIPCPVVGNPQPSITWYKGNDMLSGSIMNTNHTLKFEKTVFNNSGSYTCFAENFLGNVTVMVQLRVAVEETSTTITSSEPVTEDPGIVASEVNGSMKVTNVPYMKELANMSSKDSQNLTTRCKNAIGEVYQSADTFKDVYNDTEVNKFVNGSVVVFFTIIFNDLVRIDDAILVLRNASENGTLGDLMVEPGSIKALRPVPTTPATSSPTATTSSSSEDDKDKDMLWIIIGASVGGAIVLIIVVAVVAWCVHHKRKCRRKGSKVRCSESEAFAPEEGNDYGHANNGYADAGPLPAAMQDMSQHQGASAVPTYAVVDKSAKKASKKDKKLEEKKPQAAPPEYAAVDKSKKKKKEEPETTYAEVDKSKKSKKKPKPGEVLYADLGDFHQMQELPAVSTSPQALPPIRKPAPYGETQYADITQFLKGDATLPASNNSQGPDTGTQAAPAPEKSNSQEPGTSTKETSQATNPGGDGGPGHETNF